MSAVLCFCFYMLPRMVFTVLFTWFLHGSKRWFLRPLMMFKGFHCFTHEKKVIVILIRLFAAYEPFLSHFVWLKYPYPIANIISTKFLDSSRIQMFFQSLANCNKLPYHTSSTRASNRPNYFAYGKGYLQMSILGKTPKTNKYHVRNPSIMAMVKYMEVS